MRNRYVSPPFGAEGTLLVGFKNPALKPLIGKTLAQAAKGWR